MQGIAPLQKNRTPGNRAGNGDLSHDVLDLISCRKYLAVQIAKRRLRNRNDEERHESAVEHQIGAESQQACLRAQHGHGHPIAGQQQGRHHQRPAQACHPAAQHGQRIETGHADPGEETDRQQQPGMHPVVVKDLLNQHRHDVIVGGHQTVADEIAPQAQYIARLAEQGPPHPLPPANHQHQTDRRKTQCNRQPDTSLPEKHIGGLLNQPLQYESTTRQRQP